MWPMFRHDLTKRGGGRKKKNGLTIFLLLADAGSQGLREEMKTLFIPYLSPNKKKRNWKGKSGLRGKKKRGRMHSNPLSDSRKKKKKQRGARLSSPARIKVEISKGGEAPGHEFRLNLQEEKKKRNCLVDRLGAIKKNQRSGISGKKEKR